MGLKNYCHKVTQEVRRSMKKLDPAEWDVVLEAPNQKFMELRDPEKGISRLKDQHKILKARSRNYSRDHDLDENIATNLAHGMDAQVTRSFLNSKKEKRRKIDDI